MKFIITTDGCNNNHHYCHVSIETIVEGTLDATNVYKQKKVKDYENGEYYHRTRIDKAPANYNLYTYEKPLHKVHGRHRFVDGGIRIGNKHYIVGDELVQAPQIIPINDFIRIDEKRFYIDYGGILVTINKENYVSLISSHNCEFTLEEITSFFKGYNVCYCVGLDEIFIVDDNDNIICYFKLSHVDYGYLYYDEEFMDEEPDDIDWYSFASTDAKKFSEYIQENKVGYISIVKIM